MLNYIAEINAFYDEISVEPLSSGQQALWHALMHLNNRLAWREWFTVANKTLELYTCLDRKTILRAREKLVERGFIDVKLNGKKATSYKIISRRERVKMPQVSPQDAPHTTPQDAPILNKLNETKLNNNTTTIAEGEKNGVFVPSFEEIKAYCDSENIGIDVSAFYDYNSMRGWQIEDWKAAVRTWKRKEPHPVNKIQKKHQESEGKTSKYDFEAVQKKAFANINHQAKSEVVNVE